MLRFGPKTATQPDQSPTQSGKLLTGPEPDFLADTANDASGLRLIEGELREAGQVTSIDLARAFFGLMLNPPKTKGEAKAVIKSIQKKYDRRSTLEPAELAKQVVLDEITAFYTAENDPDGILKTRVQAVLAQFIELTTETRVFVGIHPEVYAAAIAEIAQQLITPLRTPLHARTLFKDKFDTPEGRQASPRLVAAMLLHQWIEFYASESEAKNLETIINEAAKEQELLISSPTIRGRLVEPRTPSPEMRIVREKGNFSDFVMLVALRDALTTVISMYPEIAKDDILTGLQRLNEIIQLITEYLQGNEFTIDDVHKAIGDFLDEEISNIDGSPYRPSQLEIDPEVLPLPMQDLDDGDQLIALLFPGTITTYTWERPGSLKKRHIDADIMLRALKGIMVPEMLMRDTALDTPHLRFEFLELQDEQGNAGEIILLQIVQSGIDLAEGRTNISYFTPILVMYAPERGRQTEVRLLGQGHQNHSAVKKAA